MSRLTEIIRGRAADQRDPVATATVATLKRPDVASVATVAVAAAWNPESRLAEGDCLAVLDAMQVEIHARYIAGALGLLAEDRDLATRFRSTEDAIDRLAGTPGGPVERTFRAAIEAHSDVWREMIERARARAERGGREVAA